MVVSVLGWAAGDRHCWQVSAGVDEVSQDVPKCLGTSLGVVGHHEVSRKVGDMLSCSMLLKMLKMTSLCYSIKMLRKTSLCSTINGQERLGSNPNLYWKPLVFLGP